MDIVGLTIQLVSGAVGGNVAGALMKDKNLGVLWNSVAGIVGGGLGGVLLNAVIPALASGGSLSLSAIVGDIAGGGVGGAIVMIVVALVKAALKK
jgi:uncharacterized membrane protein YeaQ/YmgE (transglycosylase-associated protein family)